MLQNDELTEKQRRFAEAGTRDCAFVGGRQSGKSEAIMARALELSDSLDSLLIYIPTNRLATRIYDELNSVYGSTGLQHGTRLDINGCTVYLCSSEQFVRGQHVEYVLVDDALHVYDDASITGTLYAASEYGVSVAYTPKRGCGVIQKPSVVQSVYENPAIDDSYTHKSINTVNGCMYTELFGHAIIETQDEFVCVACAQSVEKQYYISTELSDKQLLDCYHFGHFHDTECNRL